MDFFYDFVFEQKPHLDLISERMRGLIKDDVPIEPREMMREAAVELFRHFGQSFLAEKMEEREENILPLVQIGDFFDFSTGEPLARTGQAAVFKLLEMTAPQEGVTRIRGVAATNKQELKKILKRVDELKNRNHLKLGRELELFTCEKNGWLFHPKGCALWEILRHFWIDEFHRQNIDLVRGSPLSIYQAFERQEESLPYGFAVEEKVESDFFDPEAGLLGLKTYHIGKEVLFCKIDQAEEILISSLQFIHRIVRIFGFQCGLYFAESDENTALSGWLVQALESLQLDYEKEGNAEDPRVEIRVFDTLGRSWPMAYVEVAQPTQLSYMAADGKKHRPCQISRSTLGPFERLIGLLTECFSGQFPLWLSPQQIRVIPVEAAQRPYAEAVKEALVKEGYRGVVDSRNETVGQRVKRAQQERLPALIVVGEREKERGLVTVRFLRKDEVMREITMDDLLQRLQQEEKKGGI